MNCSMPAAIMASSQSILKLQIKIRWFVCPTNWYPKRCRSNRQTTSQLSRPTPPKTTLSNCMEIWSLKCSKKVQVHRCFHQSSLIAKLLNKLHQLGNLARCRPSGTKRIKPISRIVCKGWRWSRNARALPNRAGSSPTRSSTRETNPSLGRRS